MKRFGTVLVILGLSHFFVNGQVTSCGTSFGNAHLEHFLDVKNSTDLLRNRTNEITYIPIKFHLVGTAEGEGRLNFESVLDQLCAINENFAPLNIKFYLKDADVNEVDNNIIYNNPASAAGAIKLINEKNEAGKNAINVFITDQADTGSDGITLGYYTFNQDLIVLKKSVVIDNQQIYFVLGHELGHFFSLPHTFNGWDREPWDGTPITGNLSPGGVFNELADSSNCSIAGDMICDTPADYNLGLGWDGCRDYDGGCKDINGMDLNPDETNFMGYFIDCDEYQFSEEQKVIIVGDYESSRRSYLRVNYLPNDVPISEVAEAASPVDGSTTEFYNGVELSWNAVPNATHYLVEVRRGLIKSFYKTQSNSVFLTDLTEDRLYRWQVKPYSEINTCSPFSVSSSFRTGTMTSSTDNIDLQEHNVTIFPNPTEGASLNFILGNELTGEYDVSLLDVSGKIQYGQRLRAGSHRVEYLSLAPGFYFFKVQQGASVITKKIIVHD